MATTTNLREVVVGNPDILSTSEVYASFIEVDDQEMEAIHLMLARAAGLPEPVLHPDESPELYNQKEMSDKDIDILDNYYEARNNYNDSPEMAKWMKLVHARNVYLSLAIEETEFVWLPLTRFDEKLDAKLHIAEPTEEQWAKALEIRSRIHRQVVKYYEDRNGNLREDFRGIQGKTRRSYFNKRLHRAWQNFYVIKEMCEKFWASEAGDTLRLLRARRDDAWNLVVDSGAVDFRGDYWSLRNMEFNLHNIHGVVEEECDNPDVDQDRLRNEVDSGWEESDFQAYAWE